MEALKDVIRQVVELLVDGDYQQIRQRTSGVRLNEEDMRRAITEYGRLLIMPPEGAYDEMTVTNVETPRVAGVRQWAVAMPLWTKEEGRSDLRIELTIMDANPVVVEIDDIHVL